MTLIETSQSTADVVETSLDLAREDQKASWVQLIKSKAAVRRWIQRSAVPVKDRSAHPADEAQEKKSGTA